MEVNLDLNSNNVINSSEPGGPTHLTTKRYVDSLLSGTSDTGSAQLRADLTNTLQVATISDLKALTVTPPFLTVIVRGHTTVNDGGGGIFQYVAGSSSTDNNGTIIQPNVGTGRWHRIYDTLRPEYFGWNPTSSTAGNTNRVALQTCLDIGGRIELTQGGFLDGTGSQLLNITKPVRITGAGDAGIIFVKSTVSSTTNVIRISPDTSSEKRLYKLEGLTIKPESGTPAQHCIYIDLDTPTGKFLAQFEISSCVFFSFGGSGVRLNFPSGADGLFTSTIEKNLIRNGLFLDNVGDSINIIGNTILGANTGIFIDQVPGAAIVLIEGNNITSDGGALQVISGNQIKFRNNQCEQVNAYTGTGAAVVDILGVSTQRAFNCEVEGNNINTHGNVASCIRLDFANRCQITDNSLHTPVATTQHINVTSNSIDALIENTNKYFDGTIVTPDIVDNGQGTFGVFKDASGLLVNGWTASTSPGFIKTTDGTVTLRGAIASGTTASGTILFTLPTGFRPSVLRRFVCANLNGATHQTANIEVNTLGEVKILSGANTRLDLDNIVFVKLD